MNTSVGDSGQRQILQGIVQALDTSFDRPVRGEVVALAVLDRSVLIGRSAAHVQVALPVHHSVILSVHKNIE